jgi:hypothetical protein
MVRIVVVNDLMQSGYQYELLAETGGDFADDFRPELTPKEMLAIGVFGGKYMTDCRDEFPKDCAPTPSYVMNSMMPSSILWCQCGCRSQYGETRLDSPV